MSRNKQYIGGSVTVEAAWVMGMVLLSLSVMIRQASRLRDETLGAMCIHEAVEKGRHEKEAGLDQIASEVQDYMGNPMTFSGYSIELKNSRSHVSGIGKGGSWSHEIENTRFRPEKFMRQITVIESLGEKNGDKLQAGN